MTPHDLRALFEAVARGETTAEQAALRVHDYVQVLPYEDLGFARLDHHRALRQGFPEVIFGAGKSPAQIADIAVRLSAHGQDVLITRTTEDAYQAVRSHLPDAEFHPEARVIVRRTDPCREGVGDVLVAAAGTSDIPVAEEAALTAELMGSRVERLHDVGVAGLHRLLSASAQLQRARVIIAVAGMEGALPSVIGGLVAVPVIAVPTSIGYGAHLGGLAPLLAMLNSCAAGIGVVNIDNGFGAGALAHRINVLGREVPLDSSPGSR